MARPAVAASGEDGAMRIAIIGAGNVGGGLGKALSQVGHEVVFGMAGYTAMIGDPSGRSDTRPPPTEAEVEANSHTYAEQMFKDVFAAWGATASNG